MRRGSLARRQALWLGGICGALVLLTSWPFAPAVSAAGQEVRSKMEAARQRRLDPSRFPHEAAVDGYRLRAVFTGRSMLSAERSVFVRNHLLVEVLLTPPPNRQDRVGLGAFALRINGESHPRLAQAPGVAAYAVRNPALQEGPRLEAGAQAGGGRVVWGSGGRGTHPRFPGDPRVPPRKPAEDRDAAPVRDAAELDGDAVQENAFPEGVIVEPVAGYLYFPAEIDLGKIRKLELIFQPRGMDGPAATLRLK